MFVGVATLRYQHMVLITECHNSHKNSQSPLTNNLYYDCQQGPSITYKLFQTQLISVIFQIQLNSESLLQCIDSVYLDSSLVN